MIKQEAKAVPRIWWIFLSPGLDQKVTICLGTIFSSQ